MFGRFHKDVWCKNSCIAMNAHSFAKFNGSLIETQLKGLDSLRDSLHMRRKERLQRIFRRFLDPALIAAQTGAMNLH